MITEHSCGTGGYDIIHFWGFARTGDPATHDTAHIAIDPDPDAARSPVLDSAEWLMRRFPGRIWGFGLAYRTFGELFTRPGDALRAARAGRTDQRDTVETICAATIFDARARAYTALTYTHLPELTPPPTWMDDTRETTDTWIDLFDRRSAAAHAWAAAITLDPEANHTAITRLRTP